MPEFDDTLFFVEHSYYAYDYCSHNKYHSDFNDICPDNSIDKTYFYRIENVYAVCYSIFYDLTVDNNLRFEVPEKLYDPRTTCFSITYYNPPENSFFRYIDGNEESEQKFLERYFIIRDEKDRDVGFIVFSTEYNLNDVNYYSNVIINA